MYKKFDIELYKKHDPVTKEIVIKFFKKFDILLKEDRKYDIDLVSDDGLKVEVEHVVSVYGWNKYREWPFETINFLVRKVKYFKNLSGKEDIMVYVSKDFSKLGIIPGEMLRKYFKEQNIIYKNNKLMKREPYYEIDKKDVIWGTID